MKHRNMMCSTMTMTAMPLMALARLGWSRGSCGSKAMRAAEPSRSRNLVETARSVGSFGALLGALKAAGLDSALEGPGTFTVFAPNDDAFAKVPPEALKSLTANPAELAKVLKFHVVKGRLTSAELASVGSLRTLEGRSLVLDLGEGKVGGARVVKADVPCSNGVIHVIDCVLLPN